MNKFEKIAIVTAIICFLGIFIIGSWVFYLFVLNIIILSFSYIVLGYKLFKISNPNSTFRIVSGIILGVSLSTLLYILSMPKGIINKSLVGLNVLFSIVLIVMWLVEKGAFEKERKMILLRSLFIAVITSFFAYTTIYNSLNRLLLKKISGDESLLTYNLLMFDEIIEYDNYMDEENYLEAIESAKRSIEYGKKWRDYDTLYYMDFSGTYEKLSDAFIERGHELFNKGNYDLAKKNYLAADSVLNHKEHKPAYPKYTQEDIYWNKWNLLKTYNKLNNYEKYDIELDYLIENYSKVKDTVDLDYFYITENVANNYYKRSIFDESIYLNKISLNLIRNDSLNNLQNFRNTYTSLIQNYIVTDSLDYAKYYLDQYSKIALNDDCRLLYYSSLYYQKKDVNQALYFGQETCKCLENKSESNFNNLFEAYSNLSKIELLNSNYSNFLKTVSHSKSLIPRTLNPVKNDAKINLLLGQYYYQKGDYRKSKTYYEFSLDYYETASEMERYNGALIELRIARINQELNISFNNQLVNANALRFLKDYETNSPSLTVTHNELGSLNVVYDSKLADSLFRITLNCHSNYKIKNVPNLAIAHNGLGLIQHSQNKFKKADSLYKLTENELRKFYGANKNIDQIINFLNLAKSKFHQQEYELCEEYLNKAILTNKNCFQLEKTIYQSYILKLKGDLVKKTIKGDIMAIKNYEEALKIAIRYLSENHPYILELQMLLKE